METNTSQLEYIEELLIEHANAEKCEELLSSACNCLDNYDTETAFNEVNKAIELLKLEVRTDSSKEKKSFRKESAEKLQMLTQEMKQGNRNLEKNLNEALIRVYKTVMQCNREYAM